jgi:tRNA/tmRNA/rRNA uracil-C5-methylase (TrmA/RlmC/RlmD family)
MTYETELAGKREAVRQFWEQSFSPLLLHPLLASPQGRRYRSISKRKLYVQGRDVVLGLIDPDESATGGILPVNACDIEPASHQEVYRRVMTAISSPALRPLVSALRYLIVRGDEQETLVILSVAASSPPLVKSANALSKILTAAPSSVRAVFLHEDDSDGRYYLGSGNPAGRASLRKLYGVPGLKHEVGGKRFFYPPASFSQVNHPALTILTETIRAFLSPGAGGTLLDLYCGYGLFGLLFAGSFDHVLGADISPDSISAASDNAARQGAHNARFVRSTLDEESLEMILRRCRPPVSVILDPPRGGTAEGILSLLAASSPSRVVHLFCNIERMPQELTAWDREGYRVEAAVPVDMFPGTAALEVVAGLTRKV